MAVKKLIEVALPLEKINAESAREKSIRHGHPSTLHLWWARRPLATARAVIWASLVDDPSSHPEEFPTEEDQLRERERLFRILEDLVVWENSNNPDVLSKARAEIMKSTNGNPPALLDPFAGGGAIPLEAQRLGLEAHAHDLNPVAVMINKAMIEIPPHFADMPPVNPSARNALSRNGWNGAKGLAEDVRYYGEWMKQEAFKKIGHLYPQVDVPEELGGGKATVIAWIWSRTVKCPNPACGCEMPLVRSFTLSKKKGNTAWVKPVFDEAGTHFEVQREGSPALEGTVSRKGVVCACCGTPTTFGFLKEESKAGRMGAKLMAAVCESKKGRLYITPDNKQKTAAIVDKPEDYPEGELAKHFTGGSCVPYGLNTFDKLFTNRQLTALTTFSDLVAEAQAKAEEDALAAGMADDGISIADGGSGAKAYGQAVGVYLAFVVDKLADINSSISSWINAIGAIRNTFARQAIPMVWDYAESNPFSNSSGCFGNMLDWVYKSLYLLPAGPFGKVTQFDAQSDCGLRNIMVSSDPPYYDNIGYADLSDFFYVWMRRSLKATYPKLFRTMLVPKVEELIATPYRHEGSVEAARDFFEDGMLQTCRQIYKYAREDVPVTIYYAYKQSDTDEDVNQTASTGWETMLNAIVQAGFSITGTWPMRTERSVRTIANGTNALATSVVLVCRKRAEDAPFTTRRNFINELKRELRPALQKLQQSNLAPVDLAQSSIGPGMGIFSKYSKVLESDGSDMTVRSALQTINQEIEAYFNEQDGELDSMSQFCVALYTQHAFNDMKFGEANTLAVAKNISISALEECGVLYAQKGVVRLLERSEIADKPANRERILWLLTQQLTKAMESGGIKACAEIVSQTFGDAGERAKALAYRLYTIAEKKGWSQEAYAYNALVVSWPDIKSVAAELAAITPEQVTLF
mgnify:CR=1 FL=1